MQVAANGSSRSSKVVQAKIEKFATMLRTLNGYKAEYKKANTQK